MEIAIWIGVFLLVLISVLLMMLCSRMTYINEALDRAPQVRPVISHETRDHQELLINTLKSMQEIMAITLGRIVDIDEKLCKIQAKLIWMPTPKDIKLAMSIALGDIERKLIDMPDREDIELAVSTALSNSDLEDIKRLLTYMPTEHDIERAMSSALRPPPNPYEDFGKP